MGKRKGMVSAGQHECCLIISIVILTLSFGCNCFSGKMLGHSRVQDLDTPHLLPFWSPRTPRDSYQDQVIGVADFCQRLGPFMLPDSEEMAIFQKWELGTVFIPDSIGYLIGTNFFGAIAYKLGGWRVAIGAMLLVAISAILIPTAMTMEGLILPHLGVGLGIGVIDAALVPLLATLVDSRHSANYAVVYALQQTAVALAYALGPMLGGELAHLMGFPWLMRCIGIINLLYCPLLALLATDYKKPETQPVANDQVVRYNGLQKYNRFSNADSD